MMFNSCSIERTFGSLFAPPAADEYWIVQASTSTLACLPTCQLSTSTLFYILVPFSTHRMNEYYGLPFTIDWLKSSRISWSDCNDEVKTMELFSSQTAQHA